MRGDTVRRFEPLTSSFIVSIVAFGSCMLAGSLIKGPTWTTVFASAQPPSCAGWTIGGAPPNEKARASIGPAQTIKDGGSATFTVTVTDGNAASYQWSFKAPSGAANSPSVTFSSPTSASTSALGHWYALPDRECAPSSDSSDPYWNSVYTIVCTITFSDQRQQKAQTTLTVNAYWNPAGATGTPSISGGPTIGHDVSQDLWVVVDAGTLERHLPTPMILVPSSSQFYEKVVAHENKHVEQWRTGMLSDLYTVSSLMVVLSHLTDASQEGLSKKLAIASLAWIQEQDRQFQRRLKAAEREAHQLSDPIAPRYCYQYCGP